MALLCATVFVACNCAPTLRYLTVSPSSGTVYISGGEDGGVKAARRGARTIVRNSRRAALKPSDITTAVCGPLQFSATAYYSNGTTKDQSSTVSWASSNTSAASIDNTGLATPVGLGTTNIVVSLLGVSSAAAPLEVDLLNSITIGPLKPSVALGLTQAFTATGTFQLASGGTAQQDITGQVNWASSDPTVATIDNTGTATAVGQGTTTISATSCDGLPSNSTTLTVTPPTPQSLQVTPATSTIATGATVQFTAMEVLSDGSTQAPQHPVTWSSDTATVGPINDTTGLAQGLSAGTANITATESVSNFTASGVLTVQAATARFAYVANNGGGCTGNGSISSYTVDTTSTTPFTPLATTPATGPQQVLVHSSGDLLYYIDCGNHLHVLDVDSSTGTLTDPFNGTASPPTGPAPVVDNCQPSSTQVGVIDPTGRFIYVISSEGKCIFGFAITQPTSPLDPNTAGAMTLIPGFNATNGYTDATLNFPTWIMTDRSGKFLYVVNSTFNVTANTSGQGTISQYSINQNTGAITPLSPASVNVGVSGTNFPQFATTDTNGHVYVANEGLVVGPGNQETVAAFKIGSNGTLTHFGTDLPVSAAVNTINVHTDPTGKFLYVLDGGSSGTGQLFAYNLDTSGNITTQIGTVQNTGNAPAGMDIDPTGVLLAIDNSIDADVSLFSLASDGTATPASQATVPAGTGAAFVTFYNAASGQ
jgi:6-phosphogluconolactonase (cycloisomerase 2 family)